MSYDPTQWKSGDVVTSAKLNKMEQGIAAANESAGGGVVYTLERTYDAIVDDMVAEVKSTFTYNDVVEFLESGQMPVFKIIIYEDDVPLANYVLPVEIREYAGGEYHILISIGNSYIELVAIGTNTPFAVQTI